MELTYRSDRLRKYARWYGLWHVISSQQHLKEQTWDRCCVQYQHYRPREHEHKENLKFHPPKDQKEKFSQPSRQLVGKP